MTTVREAVFDVLRRYGMTRIFSNPGSTEVPFLVDLPDDLSFVLALHEGSVIGMATGWALASGRPAFALLHTTAGLGNAVGALATARVNRAPMVVVVGQQDRRHLAAEPFLTGHLEGLAGSYPVWTAQPIRAADVPGTLARAYHEALGSRGPALVVVPMDDWAAPTAEEAASAPALVQRTHGADPAGLTELAVLVDGARSPALVVGAGADDEACWAALVRLSERLRCPVFQEAFGARAGFPQDHPHFAGFLPAGRAALRALLSSHDVVLVVGTSAFRQYQFEPGPLVPEETHVAVVTDDPVEAYRSPADVAVVGPPPTICHLLADAVGERTGAPAPAVRRVSLPEPVGEDAALSAADVLGALARRLSADTVLVEEAPTARPMLHALLPARQPLGFLSAAMGGLGFALPAAAGLRMALPDRPVVVVAGDGSALYGIQALWSAARYSCGVLYVVLSNGRYAVMDRLAAAHGDGGGKPAWPAFDEVSIAGLARSFGCPSRRITTYGELVASLDEVLPGLGARVEPLVLDVAVMTDGALRADDAATL